MAQPDDRMEHPLFTLAYGYALGMTHRDVALGRHRMARAFAAYIATGTLAGTDLTTEWDMFTADLHQRWEWFVGDYKQQTWDAAKRNSGTTHLRDERINS